LLKFEKSQQSWAEPCTSIWVQAGCTTLQQESSKFHTEQYICLSKNFNYNINQLDTMLIWCHKVL
jgi:hypothetical protein